jgi:SOS-response transcriptional repressor LexA
MRHATRITVRQQAMLRFIRQHLTTHGYAPTIREIGDACDISSSSVVLSNLRTLTKKGRIVRQENTSRAIGMNDAPVPAFAVSRRLEIARQNVRLAKDWLTRIDETDARHPGEQEEALAGYYDASEVFFAAYDAAIGDPSPSGI